MKRKYKIISKTRFFIFMTSIFTIIIVILLSFLLKNKAHSSYYEIEYHEITVIEGDTLWEIANKYLPEDIDIRRAIYDIEKINGIDNGYIYPGNIIKIPIIYK